MSDIVKRVRGLVAEATAGPWRVGEPMRSCKMKHAHGQGRCVYEVDNWRDDGPWSGSVSTATEPYYAVVITTEEYGKLQEKNAALIAAAPTELSALCDEVERLRGVLRSGQCVAWQKGFDAGERHAVTYEPHSPANPYKALAEPEGGE